ncbi:T9SS type A sorting domain-containing protein [bacterium]|nr:T9SS type A sorting domain-containing protein [candidate division CSSED10-310 bacterium]
MNSKNIYQLCLSALMLTSGSGAALAQLPPQPPPDSYVEIVPVQLQEKLTPGAQNIFLRLEPAHRFGSPVLSQMSGALTGDLNSSEIELLSLFADNNNNGEIDENDALLDSCMIDAAGKFKLNVNDYPLDITTDILLQIEVQENASSLDLMKMEIKKGDIVGNNTFVDFAGFVSHIIPSSVEIASDNLAVPDEYTISQNYPNPFNPLTTIAYQLPDDCHVTLKIYNMLGQEVITLIDRGQKAGYYNIQWEAGRNASGLYFFYMKTQADNKPLFEKMNKMLLMK